MQKQKLSKSSFFFVCCQLGNDLLVNFNLVSDVAMYCSFLFRLALFFFPLAPFFFFHDFSMT